MVFVLSGSGRVDGWNGRMWVWFVLTEVFPGLHGVLVERWWGESTDGWGSVVIWSKEVVEVVEVERSWKRRCDSGL